MKGMALMIKTTTNVKLLAVCFAVCLMALPARAASITVVPGATLLGNPLFEFFLNTTGSEGTFDTFELIVQSNNLFIQVGPPATPVFQPSEDSGFSAFLTAPAIFGGQGLSAFGVDAAHDTTSLVSGTHASLGNNSASTQGNYFVAQVVLPPGTGGSYGFKFFDDGNEVGSGGGDIGIPEPASLALAAFSLIGGIVVRRRR